MIKTVDQERDEMKAEGLGKRRLDIPIVGGPLSLAHISAASGGLGSLFLWLR